MDEVMRRLGATILGGSAVDHHLVSEGAIAQAVSRDTILLHSAVFGMDSHLQRLVILHEAAHLEQLARLGNDSVRALEDEAWEAAIAWSTGKCQRIRGRARRPLNALAIVQGGKRGHPSAPPWYRSNPVEPIGNNSTITVKDVIVVEDMTLERIMDRVLQNKEREIVIVCHGMADELAIPLMDGSGLGTNAGNVARLSADRSFKHEGLQTPVIADKDVANQLSEEQVKKLRAKMNQVRSLGLKHVAFRSCDMGQSPDTTMDAFRIFLGAESVSAPKLFDSYGSFKPLIGQDIEAWADKKRKNEGYRMWIDEGVAFGIKIAKSDMTKYQILSKAPDNATFAKWVRTHVADRVGSDNEVVYHGMEDMRVADPKAPIVYFVRDAAFIANIVFYAG
jgi:hypothetical protein